MFAKGLLGEIFFPLKNEIKGRKDLSLSRFDHVCMWHLKLVQLCYQGIILTEYSKDGRAKTWKGPELLRPPSCPSKTGSS